MMTRVGHGLAVVSTTDRRATSSRMGRYEVMRLLNPSDAAAGLVGAICVAHEFGQEGISFTKDEARALAAMLIAAADACDQLDAAAKAVRS